MRRTLLVCFAVALMAAFAGCGDGTEPTYKAGVPPVDNPSPGPPPFDGDCNDADGLVFQFLFDGDLTDTGCGGFDGDASGDATFCADGAGNEDSALCTDGVDDYFSTEVDEILADGCSIATWMNRGEASGTTYFLSAGDCELFAKNKSVGFSVRTSSTHLSVGPFLVGEWGHFVGTFDGTIVRAYVNGVLMDEKEHNNPQQLTLGGLVIAGAYPPGNPTEFYQVALDDLRLYDYGLSEAEVIDIFLGLL